MAVLCAPNPATETPLPLAALPPVEGGVLGKNADFASTGGIEGLSKVASFPASTVNAWFLRATAREYLKREGLGFRMMFCGAKIAPKEHGVTVWHRPDQAYGRIGGVCVCGQSVVCPVCAPRIAAFRASEVEEAYKRANEAGYTATLETFTFPHHAGSSLGDEIDTFAKAWRIFTGGRDAMSVRKHQLGHQTAREITFGDLNWWNYHHHLLRYNRPGTHEPNQLRASWLAALQSVGRYTDDCIDHAYNFQPVTDSNGATYTAKLAIAVDAQARSTGLEISASSLKGRNIVRLLGDFARGDERAGKIWLHGVTEVCKRKVSSVRWSPNLRAKLCMTAEKSDAQIAQEKAQRSDQLLGYLDTQQWRRIIKTPHGEFQLVTAAQHGLEAVNEYLSGIDAGTLTEGLPEPKPSTNWA